MSGAPLTRGWWDSILASVFRRLRAWAAACLSVQPKDWSCGSLVNGRWVVLADSFVEGADQVSVRYRTRWRLPWRWLQPRLEVIATDDCNRRVTRVSSTSPYWFRGYFDITWTFPRGGLASWTRFVVQLINVENQHELGNQVFTRLDRSTLFNALRLTQFEVQGGIDDQWVATNEFHNRLNACRCRVRLDLPTSEYRSVINAIAPELRLQIHRGDRSVRSWRMSVRFEQASWNWEINLTGVGDRRSAKTYRLTLAVERCPLRETSYTVSDYHTLLDRTVTQLVETANSVQPAFSALNHRSQRVPLMVVAEDFRELSCELHLHAKISSPLWDRVDVPLTLSVLPDGHAPATHEQEFSAQLKSGHNSVRLSLPLEPAWFDLPRDSYALEVRLKGRIMARTRFRFVPRQQLVRERQAAILRSVTVRDVQMVVERNHDHSATDVLFETDSAFNLQITIETEGFDDDVAAVEWPVTLQLVNEEGVAFANRIFRLRSRSGLNRFSDIRLRVPRSPGPYCLVLLQDGRELNRHPFRVLSAPEIVDYSKTEILSSLQVSDAKLFVRCGDEDYQSQDVPFMSEHVKVCLRIHSKGFNSLVPTLPVSAELFLSSPRIRPIRVAQALVKVCPEPTMIELSLAIADTFLMHEPGAYQLQVHLNSRPVATCAFRLVPLDEFIHRLQIRPFEVHVETPQGSVLNPTELEVSNAGAVQLRFGAQAGLRAPGLSVPARIEACVGTTVLFSSGCQISFGQTDQRWSSSPMPISTLSARLHRTGATLTIRVRLGRQVKWQHSIRFVASVRCTNFEGTLTQDPQSLGNVDAEYAEIMESLS